MARWLTANSVRHKPPAMSLTFDSDIIDRYRAREDELSSSLIRENPGVRDTLLKLDCHTCIASNAPREKTRRSLIQCDLEQFFDERIYSAYDLEKWKPDPALFLHAAQTEGHPVENCLVVEDSMAGLAAAQAANMRVAFYNPRGESHSLTDVHTLTHFEELLSLI